jgi:transketolase
MTFTEDVAKRYEALGWQVDSCDSRKIKKVFRKLRKLKKSKGEPKLLILNTVIGDGLDQKKDTNDIHGSPAGLAEIAFFIQNSPAIKELFEKKYGKEPVADKKALEDILAERMKNQKAEPLLPYAESDAFMREIGESSRALCEEWEKRLAAYKEVFPGKYTELSRYLKFELPASLHDKLLNYTHPKANATRFISGEVLNLCAAEIPQIVGGSADLADSTKGLVKGSSYIKRGDFSGRRIAFGIREHAMAAIGNGLALNKTMIPFSSTFFTFFDYMKPAVRLAALMKLNHLFIFSHDSIYVGEDGPTHQPIEHLNSLRLLPNLYTFRPANDIETAFSYLYFLKHMNGPAALIATRQKIDERIMGVVPGGLGRDEFYKMFEKGGYVFYESDGKGEPGIILCGSGSEVSLARDTAALIEARNNIKVRVVSIPCLELLNETGDSYREQLFNQFQKPVVFIEAASHRGIHLFCDRHMTMIDIHSFGKSAPAKQVAEHFGFTAEAVYKRIEKQLA